MVIKVKNNGEWVKIPYLSSDNNPIIPEAPLDGKQYARQSGEWTVVNIPEVDFTEIDQKISQNTAAIASNTTAIQSKVDKVDGFGLSSNDFTSQEKTKLAGLSNYTLPTASDTVKGGIKVGSGLTMNGEVLSATGGGMADSVEWDNVLSKPKFATVATSGAYNDLTGRPNLATVATSGSYTDLSNKPTIPTVDVNKEYVDTQLATKSDLPDYTVFDIVMEITSSDNPSISQENYNKLLEKLPSNAVNTLPVRDNGMYISSFLGGYNVNGDNSIWLYLETSMGVLRNYSIQISIYQNLTVSIDSGSKYLLPTSNGIDIFTNLTHDVSENNTKQLTIYTTGDGTKALMDDGTYKSIPSLEDQYAYGVEWDIASSSPDGVRVGNMQLHRELPVQSKMRRCLLDRDGGVKEYLDNELSWGGSYLDYAVMTEMPEHWYKLYFNGTKFRMMLSEIPLPGYKHVDKFYISTYEARMYRTDNLLCSAAGASKLSDPNSINFRGGDNTAEWDDTYRSLLGCPVTSLTRDQFRQAARKRGSGWEMYTYNAHKTLFWLFAVEYATLNRQKPFNAQKDANGFAQGGLGPGPTQMTDWTNFNNANPLIPCGYTNEFGNRSGEKAYVVKNASGGTHATLMANRYRGIENPFGHIWKYTDGANIQATTGDAGLSILWTTDDPSNFSDTSYIGYDKKGNICRTNGYAKKMLLGEDGDIVATEIGGSSSTYWCDYYYTYTSANRMQVVQVGGNAAHGPHAGLAYVSTNDAPSGVSRNVGSRLCFFPKYKSTEITTTTE